MISYTDGDVKLRHTADSFGLNLSSFLSLPKEYRDALIHGGFVIEREKNFFSGSLDNKKRLKKVLSLLKKNK